MAFVNRSKRKLKPDILCPTTIGPGEYSNNKEKEEARILHIFSNIYNHPTKLTPLEIKIPFNSTGERESKMFKTNQNPGPGTYDIGIPSEKKMKEKLPILTSRDEIVFVEENNNLIPKIKREKKGFLSSEKRFFEKEDTNYNNGYYIKTEPNTNKFNHRSYFFNNKEKLHNNRYVKCNFNHDKDKIKSVPTIPGKSRGEFKIINDNIEKIKNDSNSDKKEEEQLGQGRYNIIPKLNPKSINWKYGYNKIPKSILFKKELISNFKEHKNIEKINLSVKLNYNKLKKSISNFDKSTKDNNKNLIDKKNNSMRNRVFTRHIKDRKKYLSEQMNKQKKYNNIINQLNYKETPGPGFYDNSLNYINKIINTEIFNTNKSQNFGSNTPKFYKISHDNKLLGPGSYFLEKNKYQPKIEVSVHIKKPIKKNMTNNDEGLFIQNYRMKNRYNYPGPGQYNLGKKFIKDEISNVKSFGILAQRFQKLNSPEFNDDDYDEKINRHQYTKVNYKYEDKMQYKINKRLLELKREEEKFKKKRRDKFMNKKSPAVGDYSPEFSTSISYNVKSRINSYRNNLAPFNIKSPRFSKNDKNIFEKNIPGPGDYNVANAFDALNNGIKKGYINNSNISNNNVGDNDLIKNKNNEEIGTSRPGLYYPDTSNSWSKKSFNVLFMDK